MRSSSSFVRSGELLLVEVELRGPKGIANRHLVLDTGAAATTLLPEVIEELGYSARDGLQLARVHSVVGSELGYWLRVAELTALGVSTPDFLIHVFDLGWDDVAGLVGMNFLRHFNFEVRPADGVILAELIVPQT